MDQRGYLKHVVDDKTAEQAQGIEAEDVTGDDFIAGMHGGDEEFHVRKSAGARPGEDVPKQTQQKSAAKSDK